MSADVEDQAPPVQEARTTGLGRAAGGRILGAQPPARPDVGTGCRPGWVFERRMGDDDVAAVGEGDVGSVESQKFVEPTAEMVRRWKGTPTMSETKRPGRPPIRVMPPRIPDTTGERRPSADVEGPAPPGRPAFNALRIRRAQR